MDKLKELKKYLNYEFSTGWTIGEDYKKFDLDSSCKIIRKIKHTHFSDEVFDDCDTTLF